MSARSRIAVVYLLGFSIDLANMFAINAAYPALQRELRASVAQLAWIGNLYMLGLTVVIPLGTWLARRFGERRVLAASLLTFGLGSAGAASAQSIGALLASRLVQGLGGGLLIPVGQAMTYRAYPREARAHLTSIVMMVALLVPALSPALGGVIVDHASWRGIFVGMLALAAMSCALALAWLPADAEHGGPPALDVAGLGVSAAALVSLLLGLTFAGQRGSEVWAIVSLAIAGVAGFAYVRHARRSAAPLLDLALLAQPLLRAGIVIYLCVPGVFTGVNLIASLYLQNELGLSATQTGALMVPWAAASFAAIATTRRAFPSIGAKPLFVCGIAIDCIGIVLLATPLAAHDAGRVLAFGAMGFGASLCTSASQSAAFLDVPAGRMGEASALWNINRQLSFCLGVAVLGSVLNFLLSFGANGPALLPYRQCFALGALLTLLPLPLVARLGSRRATAGHALPIDSPSNRS
ncbi:MFS transporter [Burkholderia oklahomensis]|uniref:Major Facilitator Superfamily protein n=1 Tax=Burkholderia oklahomensis TaxID=342113 RepID=A0AAI8BEE8_9BURK|nr:MFS transporter [Burkholderia oklahomensis]AIO70757.1 major Facilitator Superfamily protein [Burkholderia oklahomensis]AOI38873.1 disulfide bond formation protein DsbA [Burkholderia oklahomensis EO147]KUY65577.1 disulfide bond formation protein DsbA [Burkholderia oklahomensis EO147]QPS40781.1 MFS transporter [Burkholderia oklahomensis]